jgi:hypothetical protein
MYKTLGLKARLLNIDYTVLEDLLHSIDLSLTIS